MSSASPPTVVTPLADLTYRNYDGPLRPRAARWWIVALATLRMVRQKAAFWIVSFLVVLPFLGHGFQLYLQNQLGGGMNRFLPLPPAQKYALVFFQTMNGNLNSICLFLIALIAGAGSIAADNRANALLVYLAKPITKGDYLLGKWMGVFLCIFSVILIPALLLYSFCGLSYADDGFFKNDPLLIVHVLLAALIPAVIHASLIIGFSSWSKSAGIASAIYAGLYFVGGIVVGIGGRIAYAGDTKAANLTQHLSIEGVIDGLSQRVLNVQIPDLVRFARSGILVVSPPPLGIMLALAAVLVVGGIAAARARIRAVEVVRG